MPTFEEAKNQRQRARAAGLHPDYWYAVEQSSALKKGQVRGVTFWKRSFALFRGDDGVVRALEDRCVHRQLKLSRGVVEGCKLTCMYHGWRYDETGKVEHIPHEIFGKPMPTFRIGSFPVQERYGLIWLFPGDPALAEERRIPDIAELGGEDRWACVPLDFTLRCHHTMIVENICDFTHAFLHRDWRPFWDAHMTHHEAQGDRVLVEYDTKVGSGPISRLFVDRKRAKTDHMVLAYQYPYQWSNTGDKIRSHCFVLPIDERTTRTFFLFYFDALQVPLIGVKIPQRLLTSVLRVANKVLITPIIKQDAEAVELEQVGYEEHHHRPFAEFNPIVPLFQELTVRKWQEHLDKEKGRQRVKLRPAAEAAG